jgi:hypothetical protein
VKYAFSFDVAVTPDNIQLELVGLQSAKKVREKSNLLKCGGFRGLLSDSKYRNVTHATVNTFF